MINYENIQVKDYFKLYEEESKKYGNNVIILMQVGSFHEVYSTEERGPPIKKIADELDIIYTKKNKKKDISESNPYMLGFPTHSLQKFVDLLVKKNYTLVIVDQVSDPPKPVRKITNRVTPSTYIDARMSENNNYGNYLVSIVIDSGINMKKEESIMIGISAVDLVVGRTYYHEGISKNYDATYSLDDACRFLQRYPPSEVIWMSLLEENKKINKMSIDDIIEYLNLPKTTHNLERNKVKSLEKISYQRKKIMEIYNLEIEELEKLDKWNLCRLSLMICIYYIERINVELLNRLNRPEMFINDNNLHLGSGVLRELNFMDNNGIVSIIDFTETLMGKRFLKENISNPLTDEKELLKRYDDIKKNKNYIKIKEGLKNIYDMDKIIRKIELENILPMEFYKLYLSLNELMSIKEEIKIENTIFNGVNDLSMKLELYFDMSKIISLNNLDVRESIFNKGIFNDIDNIQNKIEENITSIEKLKEYLEKSLEEGKYLKDKSIIKIERNSLDGEYLSITEKRGKKLEIELKKKNIKILNITSKNYMDELEFDYRNKNCKIKGRWFENNFIEKLKLEKELVDLVRNRYRNIIKEINEEIESIKETSKFVGYLDFINSGSILLNKYHYCIPEIKNKSSSYLRVKNMRHPLVERLGVDYKPHNIVLGKKLKGMLLYGVNSAGKSTLMKSVGVNIILAQIGYPVCAESLTYKPYHNLFTRILGNDNIYSGLSSFMVEMIELNAILKRNNENTLVIADELCRGTEVSSANIIVAYMIEELSKNGASFITASHLHEIIKLENIKKLSNVCAYHLDVKYKDGDLVYNRSLEEGSGRDFYGLEIAKYIIDDKKFIKRTLELSGKLEELKCSKYNNKLVLDKCEICGSKDKLETHHIIFQKEFNKRNINKKKYNLVKNDITNLVCLCSECHDDVDRENIVINGWVNKKLDYKKIEK